MYYRQKILLTLLHEFGGEVSNTDFQKYLFLLSNIQGEKSYEFVPYKYGCFSFQSYADKRRLTTDNILENQDNWKLKISHSQIKIKQDDELKIKKLRQFIGDKKGNELIKYVYLKHPYYATRSEIAKKILSSQEFKEIEKVKPTNNEVVFYTIGYEGATLEGYLNKLIKNDVKVLCDVRKNPLSRKYGFSRLTLSDCLNKVGISYIHIPELGIESDKRKNLDSQTDYDNLFSYYKKNVLPKKTDKIKQLHDLLMKHKRVAITCFEADVCQCHRNYVAQAITSLPEWKEKLVHL